MTRTLEQELADVTAAQGYAVRFSDSTYFHVYLYHHGKQIDHKLFTRWLWHRRRAARWIRHIVREHELMLSSTGVRVQ